MKKRYKFPLIGLSLLTALALLAVTILPWKLYLANRLEQILAARGVANVNLTIADIGLNRAHLRDITIGAENPLTLENLTIAYEPRALLDGQLDGLDIRALTITARKTASGWQIDNLTTPGGTAGFTLPDTPAALPPLPFQNITLENSRLNIITPSWHLAAPLRATWHNAPAPALTAAFTATTLTLNQYKAHAPESGLTLTLTAHDGWDGTWQAGAITVTDGPALPALAANGTIRAQNNIVTVTGTAASADKNLTLSFTYIQDLTANTTRLTLNSATMNWKGGTLSTRNAVIPLDTTTPYRLTLAARNISVDELMQAMTGKRVAATGTVSGTLPLTIARNGTITLGKGSLAAPAPGTITMPPDAIPGDNPQIDLTRRILNNFNYDSLAITTESGPGDTILLALEGNNPDVYNGRAVKLNVRLTGDVLDFIRQNVILLTTPEKLIQQDQP